MNFLRSISDHILEVTIVLGVLAFMLYHTRKRDPK